ncbi:hypothetical protein BCR43DRAFT_498508 [Syncephalastrum racemosum]|uniref:F-box domain-containing protein n=1 Tax=Syncephalastrum racemosum TaxID=13706 RepID=A0A1X2H160_SYNRA|nr:hypothetical protein BCR43DRAFT_498508 [Syncephalastrum racemosum]
MASSGWCNLSVEILHQIAAIVPLESSLTCALVCQSWYGPFTRRFYREVHPKNGRKALQLLNTLDDKMYSKGAYVRSLIIPMEIERNDVKQLIQLCPHLEKLALPGGWLNSNDITDTGFWKDWPVMQRLTSLETEYHEEDTVALRRDRQWCIVNGTRYPPQLVQNVRQLRLSGNLKKLLTSLTTMPNLLSLSCRGITTNSSIDDATITAFTSTCPQLNTLCVYLARFWLHGEPTSRLKSVRTLILHRCSFMSVASFAMLSHALPNIEHLVLDTASIPHQPSSRAQLDWNQLKHVTIYFHRDTIGLIRMQQTLFATCSNIQSARIFIVADLPAFQDDEEDAALIGHGYDVTRSIAIRFTDILKQECPNADITWETIDQPTYFKLRKEQGIDPYNNKGV